MRVMIGVDPHKGSHTAVAVDAGHGSLPWPDPCITEPVGQQRDRVRLRRQRGLPAGVGEIQGLGHRADMPVHDDGAVAAMTRQRVAETTPHPGCRPGSGRDGSGRRTMAPGGVRGFHSTEFIPGVTAHDVVYPPRTWIW
jgi:hypothetical protein